MQTAARLVLDENRKLRRLLEPHCGISKPQLVSSLAALEQVQEPYIAGTKAGQSANGCDVHREKPGLPCPTVREPAMSSDDVSIAPKDTRSRDSQRPLTTSPRTLQEGLAAPPWTQVSDGEARNSTSLHNTTSNSTTAFSLLQSQSNPQVPDEWTTSPVDGAQPSAQIHHTPFAGTDGKGDKSCEEAAMIIASLRGGVAPEDIYGELGCSADKPCAVANTSIFELLDRG